MQSKNVYQRATGDGDWIRSTSNNITDECENYTETIQNLKETFAGEKHHIEASQIHLGNKL